MKKHKKNTTNDAPAPLWGGASHPAAVMTVDADNLALVTAGESGDPPSPPPDPDPGGSS